MARSTLRRLLVVGLAPTLLLAAGAVALAGTGNGSKALLDPVVPPKTSPQFASPCKFSHRASDDPIVFPRKAGRSHSHDFIGNTGTNAFSTYAKLRAGGTSCKRDEDTAAYWVPTLYHEGKALQPIRSNIYYLPGGKDPASIKAFPTKLKIIAGDAKAKGPQDLKVLAWHCGAGSQPNNAPPVCGAGDADTLIMRIRFPDCWDGRNRDSKDHKGHMAYASPKRRGEQFKTCPDSHPVPVPELALNVRYPTPGGGEIKLASGAHFTGHADFLNAWDQGELERLVARCLNGQQHCGAN